MREDGQLKLTDFRKFPVLPEKYQNERTWLHVVGVAFSGPKGSAVEWHMVPPTVIRDGPHGVGSMQWFVNTKSRAGYYLKVKDTSILKQAALFDYLVNNADRKLSHFLEDKDGLLWLVDHGLTFNAMPKLRTVLWDFSGQTVPDELLADVKTLQSKLKQEKQLRNTLRRLLEQSEVEALEFRINAIIKKPMFVHPGPYRSVPWPWY